MPALRFSATIVTYRPDARLLERALGSLAQSVRHARDAGLLSDARVFVVDNGPAEEVAVVQAALAAFPHDAGEIELVHGHGNLGYGRANNIVLPRLASGVHLVANPDVELDRDALAAAIAAMNADANLGLVAPSVRGSDGARQYLCKRYPSLWVLFLRGFAPEFLRQRYARALADYEMRDIPADEPYAPVTLASGAFMLMRTSLFKNLGGFDPRFFMYFEDYDLSLRAGRECRVAYIPAARIVHHGGEAARKGLAHVGWFVQSAFRFFAKHGWKVY